MGNKSNEILNAAIRLFAENGYHATSMRDIAKVAKIVQSSIYNHYKSKESILIEIVKLMKSEISQTFELDTKISGKKAMKAYLNKVNDSIHTNPQFWRLIHTIRMNKEIMKAMEPELKDLNSVVIANITTLLQDTGKKHGITDSLLFWAAIDGIVAAYLIIDDYPLDQVFESLVKQYYKE